MEMNVVAVGVFRTRRADSDEPYTQQPVAWVIGENGEKMTNITREQYQAFLDAVEHIDYAEGDYVAFDRPLGFSDVFSDSRGL
jgi:hypothetical protein